MQLSQADLIVSTLGTDPQVISAAKGLVAAEQNFNPFVVDVPSICSDPTLPTTAALRGVVPLVDPSVGGASTENANSATSLTTAFSADGLSVAQVMVNAGFSNFTTKAVDGTVGTASGASSSSNSTAASSVSSAASTPAAVVAVAASSACGGTTLVT